MQVRMPRTHAAARRGFTLIEVLVGLTILTLSLGVLYQSFGWSLHRSSQLATRELAWLEAHSRLTEVALDPAGKEGTRSGRTEQGMEWASEVRQYLAESPEGTSIKVFEVTVTVSWGARAHQHVTLTSIELGRERSV